MNGLISRRGDMTDEDFKAWIAHRYGEGRQPQQRSTKRDPRIVIEHHWNIRIYKSTVYINRDVHEEYESPPNTEKH